jgi:hypothetical protein
MQNYVYSYACDLTKFLTFGVDLILFLDPLLTHVYIHLEGPLICESFTTNDIHFSFGYVTDVPHAPYAPKVPHVPHAP